MAPKLAAVDTWRSHATVRTGLVVPGRPIGPWSRRTGAPEASATGRDRINHGATSGPRTTGLQRTTPVNTGSPSAEVTGHTPPPPQVAATPRRSLTRKRTEVQLLPRPPHSA
jgi:hypothetical protein